MQLQIGDRIADETGEWEVVGRPYTIGGGKNARVRVQGLGRPESQELRAWGAHEKVSVKREPHRRYHPAMPWRAKCDECGQEVPITRPLYGK
jgi:hypothetical protein